MCVPGYSVVKGLVKNHFNQGRFQKFLGGGQLSFFFLIVHVQGCVCVCDSPSAVGGPRGPIDKNSNFYPLLAKNFKNSICRPPVPSGGGGQGGPTDKDADFYPLQTKNFPLSQGEARPMMRDPFFIPGGGARAPWAPHRSAPVIVLTN